MTSTYIFFPLLILLYFLSITGFGKLFLKICNLNSPITYQYKNLEFFFGLILVGFFSLLFNFKYSFIDIYSISIIIIGIIIYLFFFINNLKKLDEIYLIFFIVLIAYSFSFYSLSNDDFFGYHLKTIVNFKNYNLFEIEHGRTTSYNSHWLLINSVYFLKFFPASIFCLLSLLYSITLIDFYKAVKNNYDNKNYITSLYSFFCLVFFIGVLNQYKDFGTDLPGQIILFYFILIFFEKEESIFSNHNTIFTLIVFLAFFSFIIKIYNGLIFIFLFLIFLQLKNKIYSLIVSIIISIPTFFWILQNYIISKCLIWPITFFCFSNFHTSKNELRMIETFAKGDIAVSFDIKGMNWIPMWFTNHFHKIIETYALYILILVLPPIIYYFRLNYSDKLSYFNDFKEYFYKYYNSYKSFIFFIVISNIVWFFYIPAYRFGIFYNLTFILILLIPFWKRIITYNKNYYFKSFRIIFSIALIFFLIENISKYSDYVNRHGYKWPNIEKIDLN